ncbi:MAG: hypothetical protein L5655_10850 [Thermosediminibacteraceae bacterium]|nr:hypothetical protein [Thermosediminibacteraceae bacterium]
MYTEVLNNVNKMYDEVAQELPITLRQKFEAEKEKITRELDECRKKIEVIKSDVDLTKEAQQRRISEVIANSRKAVDDSITNLIKLVQDAKAQAEKELTPAKPEAIDQGTLLNLKSDLRMVLDSLEPRQAIARMAEALEQFIAEGDTLGIWLLGASNWPKLYAESRKVNAEGWEILKGKVLAKYASESQIQARNLLQKLARVDDVIKGLRLYAGAVLDSLAK